MPAYTQQGKQISGREIHFLSRDEIDYPQLTRLCVEFDYRVLGVNSDKLHPTTQYVVSERPHCRDQVPHPITPLFDSLAELEYYTNVHIIDILHHTLLEDSELE